MQLALSQVRSHSAALAPDAVAQDAAFIPEQPAALVGAAGQDVERLLGAGLGRGVEVGDQVAKLRIFEGGARDPIVAHGLGHGRAMVPQLGRDQEGGSELLEEVQVRAGHPTGPARLVADDALFLR